MRSKNNNNKTYKDILIKVLKKLGGEAHLSEIYTEFEKISKKNNKELPKSYKDIIRATLERHSSDTDSYKKGNEDLFCLKEKGTGIWGLRNRNANITSISNKENFSKGEINCFEKTNLKLSPHIKNSFYHALKTKGFVILAGLSGTGKTKIFEEFVKCFQFSEEDKSNNLFLSIRPDFKDTKSLLGFYNPLKKDYHSTPLLDIILYSIKNYLEKGNNADPFFILFDEMNLARVEYYFADFLSVLEAKRFKVKDEALKNTQFINFLKSIGKDEKPINENNFKFTSQSIKLHNENNSKNNENNLTNIPKELFLPPNLYIVGTVNIDDTTYMFSPKVLDRAFTIEFDVGSFDEYLEFLKNNSGKLAQSEDLKEDFKKDFINKGKFAIIDKNKVKEFSEKNKNIVEKLEKINQVLRRFNLHFGYRVFDEIMMFLYNSQNSKYCKFEDSDKAFDLVMKMKILPKFHGTRQKLEEPIIEFLKILELKFNNNSKDNNQSNFMDKDLIKKISENLKGIPIIENQKLKINLNDKETEIDTPYLYTVHKLLEMLYKLKSQGFASFM